MTQISETIAELREFVTTQATQDAELDSAERRYQADLVKDVLGQEALKPAVVQSLVEDYSSTLAQSLNKAA